MSPLRIVAIANQKGGVGKTTTAVNLAAGLARRARRVLLVDLDPSTAASTWLCPERDEVKTLDHVFAGCPTAKAVIATPVPHLSLLPGSPFLAARSRALTGQPGSEWTLRVRLAQLDPAAWDFCLIDCPPELGLLNLNGLLAARELLVPVSADPMALDGLARIFETLEDIAEHLDHPLALLGILPVRVRPRTLLSRRVLGELEAAAPGRVLPVAIRDTIHAQEAPSHHLPILEYSPRCSAAADYERLVDHLLGGAAA